MPGCPRRLAEISRRQRSRSACSRDSAWDGEESRVGLSWSGNRGPGMPRSTGIGSKSTGSSRARRQVPSSTTRVTLSGGHGPSEESPRPSNQALPISDFEAEASNPLPLRSTPPRDQREPHAPPFQGGHRRSKRVMRIYIPAPATNLLIGPPIRGHFL